MGVGLEGPFKNELFLLLELDNLLVNGVLCDKTDSFYTLSLT